MSKLASQAELIKLAAALKVDVAELQFMSEVASDSLRRFRAAYTDILFNQQRHFFRRVAWWARWLPSWFVAGIVRFWLGSTLTARMASELPAWRVAAIARHLPAQFMADVAVGFDPRAARELVWLLSTEQIVSTAHVLLQRRDFITMGRFVGLLPDHVVQQVAASIEDEGDLLDIIFHVDSRNRIDHLVHVLPAERVHRAMLIVCNTSQRRLWPKLLALVANVSYSLKRELGDLAASQGEAVLEAIVNAAQEDQLWEDILPVVTCLSPDVQRLVINLPALQRAEVMASIIETANKDGLWTDIISIAAYMNDTGRDAVAQALTNIPGPALEHAAYAALMRSQWNTILDIVRRMPASRHAECVQIFNQYIDVLDPETAGQISGHLQEYGIIAAELVPA